MTKTMRALAILVLPLIALSLACSALGGPQVSVPTGVSVPTADNTTVLFQDDFSDTSSGWDRVQTDEGVTDYDSGTYRIFVDKTQHDYWANPGRSFTDAQVEVDATKVAGPDQNDFGLICRSQDTKNFYAFIVGSDGTYAIEKFSDSGSEILGSDAMQQSDAIRQGAATNHLRADCVGDSLSLYVNGQLVHSVTDSSYASGDVGLIAGTYDEAGADIAFDDLVVRQP